MTNWIQSIIRPLQSGTIQPVVMLWLWATTENMWEHYINTGWGLQTVITLYLIPIYHYYDIIYNQITKNAE